MHAITSEQSDICWYNNGKMAVGSCLIVTEKAFDTEKVARSFIQVDTIAPLVSDFIVDVDASWQVFRSLEWENDYGDLI